MKKYTGRHPVLLVGRTRSTELAGPGGGGNATKKARLGAGRISALATVLRAETFLKCVSAKCSSSGSSSPTKKRVLGSGEVHNAKRSRRQAGENPGGSRLHRHARLSGRAVGRPARHAAGLDRSPPANLLNRLLSAKFLRTLRACFRWAVRSHRHA